VTRFLARSLLPLAASTALLGLPACSTIENFAKGDKIDYRTTGARTAGLDVPPDLTKLARDSRYQAPGGTVSATAFQAGTANPAAAAAAASASAGVAPAQVGELRIERQGNQRWLSSPLAPDQMWPQLQAFWKDLGFQLVLDQASVGVMETEWAENRAKLPNDIIRNTLGRVFDSLYSTGERDKFRTRVERTPTGGSEVYISHRGMEEVYSNDKKDSTVWQPRAPDPQIEAEFLSRLMLRLGAKEELARPAAVAAVAAPGARARVVADQAVLQVDDSFDRAWRRVGLALDRSGFTVEDRDRAQGLYFVRYVDPALMGKEEPGFFSRIFRAKPDGAAGPARYRVLVKGDGERSTVSVLTGQGAPESGEAGRRIVALLVQDLK
jgi:outer membrane protein assembly factor BamC